MVISWGMFKVHCTVYVNADHVYFLTVMRMRAFCVSAARTLTNISACVDLAASTEFTHAFISDVDSGSSGRARLVGEV